MRRDHSINIDRRTFIQGLSAGGALLALGVPSWAFADSPDRRAKHCVLLLGDTRVDDAFAKGARAACAGAGREGLQTMKLKGGLLADPGKLAGLLERSRGARWLAVMDDANAAVFQELARSVGVRLLSVGSHASSEEGGCSLRHVWVAASPGESAGGLLASHFIGRQGSFSIAEYFLKKPSRGRALKSWSAPGFVSYRLFKPDAMHLHCSGLSLSGGCGLLGLEKPKRWVSIPPGAGEREAVAWQSGNWVESVGYAVTASALGVNSVQESCSSRAFVHRTHIGGWAQLTEGFVSFVMDV